MEGQHWLVIGLISMAVNIFLLRKLQKNKEKLKENELQNSLIQDLNAWKDDSQIVDVENVVSAIQALKMPVGAVEGILQFMQRYQSENLNGRQKEHLSLALGTIERIGFQLSDYRDALDLKQEEKEVKLECISIHTLINQVMRAFEQAMKQKQISLLYHFEEEHFYADPPKIKQILYNILELIIPCQTGGTLEFKSHVLEGVFCLEILSTGDHFKETIGMELFEMFNAVGDELTTKRSKLSLILSERNLSKMGGHLTAQRMNDTGLLVRLELQSPDEGFDQLKFKKESPERPALESTNVELQKKVKGQIAIMYADPIQRHYLSSILMTLGYAVTDLQKSEQLRTLDLRKLPDLVIINVEDGSVESLNAIKALRSIREKIELPILACTNAYDRELVGYLFDFGANDFITKPLEQSQLTMRIDNLMSQKKAFTESLKAELNLLQAQIKPHFLYNALSAVVSMCYTDPQAAANTLIDLSRYLRLIFESTTTQLFVPIKQELALIEAYVAVEKARFGERLKFTLITTDRLMAYKIPFLLIQPFVENAIKHGICNRDEGGEVTLTFEEYGNYMVVEIKDNGIGIDPALSEEINAGYYKQGSGLKNVTRRLSLIKESHLEIDSDSLGTTIRITIPIRSDI